MIDHYEAFGRRLKMLRRARGMTLEELASATGGMVTKQAISKYERELMLPSPRVTAALARSLGVRSGELMAGPGVVVEVVAFRKLARLSVTERTRVEGLVSHMLERRVKLQQASGAGDGAAIPVLGFSPSAPEECEDIAAEVRRSWALGSDPIASVTDVLEEHQVHVLELDAERELDGLAAVARDTTGQVKGAAVVSRRGIPGERQRLNLAHELGHLVIGGLAEAEEEAAAFRFGGAFLAPAELVRRDVGRTRRQITLAELMLLKKRYGMSMQALVYRLRDLGVIAHGQAAGLWKQINARGWKKREPGELPPERPQWARRAALRAIMEGALTRSQAEELLGAGLTDLRPVERSERRALAALPLAERRRRLQADAAHARAEYEENQEWRELLGGDLLPDD